MSTQAQPPQGNEGRPEQPAQPLNATMTQPQPDPLLTALSQMLARFDIHKSEEALATGIPHERPLQPAGMMRIAEAHGCKVRIQHRDLTQINPLQLPVVLLLQDLRACLLLDWRNDGKAVILPCEPGAIELEVTHADLQKQYIGTCLLIRPAIADRPSEGALVLEHDLAFPRLLRPGGGGGATDQRAGAGRHLLHDERV